MYEAYRTANRNVNIAGTVIGTGVAALGGYIVFTTPMTIDTRWGTAISVLAAVGAAFLASTGISWLERRFQLDKPTRLPVTWRIRRRWYGPHQLVTVDGRNAVALAWNDEAGYGPRTWVLVMSWADGAHPDDNRVEWRPLNDLTPRRAA